MKSRVICGAQDDTWCNLTLCLQVWYWILGGRAPGIDVRSGIISTQPTRVEDDENKIAPSYSMRARLLQSCPTLFTPWTVAHQAPLSMGFSRHEYWSGLPFPSPEHRPDPGIQPTSPARAGELFTTEPPGKPTQLQQSSLNKRKFEQPLQWASWHLTVRFP